jgi:hypothetical protein
VGTLMKCDRCGKTGEVVRHFHAHHGHMPKGWSSIVVNIESTQRVPMVNSDAWGDAHAPRGPHSLDATEEVPVMVPSNFELCPDCTNMFVVATGEKLIKRTPDAMPPPPSTMLTGVTQPFPPRPSRR